MGIIQFLSSLAGHALPRHKGRKVVVQVKFVRFQLCNARLNYRIYKGTIYNALMRKRKLCSLFV
jgi:hypothetical protein